MAEVLGVNAALIDGEPTKKTGVGDTGGRVRVHYDSYTVDANLAQNDTIRIGSKLPAGARVLFLHAHIGGTALDGAGGALEYGYADSEELDGDGNPVEAADSAAFRGNIDPTGTGVSDFSSGDDGNGKKFAAEVQPQILVGTALNNAAGGTLKLMLMYTVD